MKKKLTVTIDEDLIPRAKRYARQRGVSLSSLIEDALDRMTSANGGSFVERWRESFEPVSADDERGRPAGRSEDSAGELAPEG